MGLFDQIVGAINNPNQQANPDQLGGILNTVQQFAGQQGMDSTATQTAISVVGSYVRSALQQQRDANGQEHAESLVNQYAGTGPNPSALQALFTPNQQQEIAQAIAQRTGLNPQMVQMALPMLVPLALNLLKTGSTTTQPTPQSSSGGANSVLGAFLDADHDGDVDLGDTLAMAGRYLNR